MTRGLSVVVTSMLPALPTDSWLSRKRHAADTTDGAGNEGKHIPVAGGVAELRQNRGGDRETVFSWTRTRFPFLH